jgi:signal transduction histidine kinase
VTRLSTEFVNLPPDDSVSTHIQRAMETVSTFVGVDACQLWLFGADPSTLTLAHTWSAPSFAQASTDALSAAPHSWLLGQLQHLETVYMPSVDALPAEAQSLRTTWQQASVQSTLQVPLVASERLVGVISFYTTHPIPTWSEDVTQLLTMVGAIFVQALQRQQAEQQRHALIAERERIGFLQEFMGNVTHDIKNPLSVIRTSLYVARKASDPDRRLTSLNTIERQADRIDALVEDLLLLTRLDSDQPLELVVVDLKPLLEDVVGQQRPLAAEKHLAYEVSLPTTLPPVLAHADDIRRVFVNLIENAIRYTLDGCSIAIRARSEAKTVFIEVTDTGIGIPASDVPRVFDRFFRAENASSMSERGTGLGLAIVQRIVEKHGGQIVVESEEGRGSTFRVALPRWDGSGPQPVPVH